MSNPIIQLESLTKTYDQVHAVNKLSLSIKKGEIFGLLGPNGAGKSTTILMMLGLTEPTSGSVNVCGINSTREAIKVKQRVGYLPDDVGFYADRTGLENLTYTALLNGFSRDQAVDKALSLLKRVGLSDTASKKVGKYSRGMKQRLGLADVLIKDPEVIILDEPTLGIDPEGVRDFLKMIKDLSRQNGLTVLLSSHHLHQVQQICDRVGLFVEGRLLAAGQIDELAHRLFEEEPIVIDIQVGEVSGSLIDELDQMTEVVSVTQINDSDVQIKCKSDISSEIAKAVVNSGHLLLALQKKHHGLDEIYHRYFEGGEKH